MAFDLDSTKHIKSSEKASGNSSNVFGEFANSLIYSAIEEPLLGLSQIVDKTFNNKTIGTNVMPTINEAFAKVGITASEKAEFGSMRWGAQQLGGAVGMMLPFMLCRKAIQASAIKFFGEAAIANGVMDLAILSKPNFLKLAAKEMSMSAATGFSYDSIFRPSQNYIDKNGKERSFLTERLINGATGAATFATLSGCGLGLRKIGLGQAIAGKDLTSIFKNELTANEKLRLLSSEALRNPIGNGIVSAVPAGLVSAEGKALSSERHVPTIDEAKESIGSFAFIGSALGTAHHLGAQREGSARTNLDYLLDKAGAKASGKTVNSEFENKRTFKHLSDGEALKQFNNAVKSGKDAQIILPVREYLGKGIFGGGLSSKSIVGKLGIWGDKYGEVRQILLKHEGKPLNIQQAGQAGLIASCQLLGSELGPRAVFKQNQAGENPVWMNMTKKDHFVLSTDKGMEPKADSKVIRLGDEVVQEGVREVDLILSKHEKELEAHLLNGNWVRAKRLVDNELVTEEFLKSERVSRAAESLLEKLLLEGRWYYAQDFMKSGLVPKESLKSERVGSAAESLLEKLLLKGDTRSAQELMNRGLVTEESLRSEKISKAAEYLLEQLLEVYWQQDAIEEFMKIRLVTNLKSERISRAVTQALKNNLLDGEISLLEPIIEHKLLDDKAFNDIFIESIQAGQVTSTVRAALTTGKDFKKISVDYLGASSLTDVEAVKLFEKMKKQDLEWYNESDIARFEDGAAEFGAARMLRYVHSANASPHEILDGFGDVLKLYRSSGLSISDFYNNILSQVSRDNAINDTGHSFARLKSIAANYSDKSFSVNFDLVMDKARKYFKVKDIEELSAKFPDKQSVFASWPRLVQFAKLEHYINQADLLPEIQRLKASGDSRDVRYAKWLETLSLHADSNVQKDAIDGFLLNENPYKFLDRDDEHSSVLHQHLKPSNYVRISNLDLTASELRDALIDGTLDRLQSFTPMKVEYEVGGVELASELKRAFGSSKRGMKGEAQNPGKLFSHVSKLLKESNLTVNDLLNGLQISSELDGRIKALLYNKEVGLANQPSTLQRFRNLVVKWA